VGISAGKLANDTGLSVRRTYKCLRGMKGKKLIFIRRTPKVYALTCKGEKLASMLQELQQIVEDTWNSSKQVMQDSALKLKVGGLSDHVYLS
jgi:sugar-specific transcriptional regulator TrmB